MKVLIAFLFSILCSNFIFSQSSVEYSTAQAAFEKGNYAEASELFSEVIVFNGASERYEALYSRAYCYYKLENYTKAKADLKVALKIKPGHPNYKFIKGSSYWMYANIVATKGPSQKSLKLLKKASLYTQTSLLYSTIGFEEIYLKKYADAMQSLNTSIKLDDKNAYAYSNRALAYVKLNRLVEAKKDIERSIQLDAKNPYAYKHRALIFIALKDYEAACHDLDLASELEGSTTIAGNNLEEVVQLQQKYCQNAVKSNTP